MDQDQRRHLREVSAEITGWVQQARTIVARRGAVAVAGEAAAAQLRRRVIDAASHDDGVLWRIVPLTHADTSMLDQLACWARQRALTDLEEQALAGLEANAAVALRDAKALFGIRQLLPGQRRRHRGVAAATYLHRYRAWAQSSNLLHILDQLTAATTNAHQSVPGAAVLSDGSGWPPQLGDLGDAPTLLIAGPVQRLPWAVHVITEAVSAEQRRRETALAAGTAVRRHEARRMLAEMPVDRLRDATRDRIRTAPLTSAGITTIHAVLEAGRSLEKLPGIGTTTAARLLGAAHTLQQTVFDEMPVRIDIQRRSPEVTDLLHQLRLWDKVRVNARASTDLDFTEALALLASAIDPHVLHLMVFGVGQPSSAFADAVAAVCRRAQVISDVGTAGSHGETPIDPWDDFLARPGDYFALLAELGLLGEDEQKTHGDLPEHIVEAVRALNLNTQHLKASLRGYQSFGARFALVQRKVIIGDEMGLGKTVEALAVLAHLHSVGEQHHLVVCPAAVVTNWVREIQIKSTLRPHRIHGPGRDAAVRNWLRGGGVAITTYETLPWFEPHLRSLDDLACLVADEAHYLKNPATRRARQTTAIINRAARAVLLTGTPLENRLDEFATLVGYLRPDLTVHADELSARRFRSQVAPAYLRRNQEDVLTELPDLVEVEEWLPMSVQDTQAYREAVAVGNFMAMRQAAMISGPRSQKMQRLIELVAEAEDNGRRVIVFSHFRDILSQVTQLLPGRVFGPLTGSVPAAARQAMVDEFSAAGHGAVLAAQILAGGVGLNIQAASVVIICEPQLKPTIEWQAIARARRMGQLMSVQVHRLLTDRGVDQRIVEILARKKQLFDGFARVSDTADYAPEAVDISEADLAREVIAAERERLLQPETTPQTGGAV